MKKFFRTLLFTFLIGFGFISCKTQVNPYNIKDIDNSHPLPYMEFTSDDYPTTPKPNYTTYVYYEDYGAKGDSITDDSEAIYAAHEYANSKGLPVKAKSGAQYLIKNLNNKTAIIKTDTDWTGATFIIDDSVISKTTDRNNIFSVRDEYSITAKMLVDDQYAKAYADKGLPTPELHPELKTMGLKKDAKNLGVTLPAKSVVWLQDENVMRFKRVNGSSVSGGSYQEDTIVVEKDGTIDSGTPINWNYNTFTKAHFKPIKEQTLYITGGTFYTKVTKINQNVYMNSGIEILRSNVVIDNVKHHLIDEGTKADKSAPYHGIFYIKRCAYITIKNCTVSSHITYSNVSGTYDIFPYEVAYLTIFNCDEFTDIQDDTRWGVIGSNFCKSFRLINSRLSRYDAHQGLTHGYIKDSVIGHGGINLTGEGTFTIENSTSYGQNFITLRKDYGSTWHGNIYIRNCEWLPRNGESNYSSSMACIFGGDHGANTNGGPNYFSFDFGYPCYMPEKLFIDGFTIDDSKAGNGYTGPHLLSPFVKAAYTEAFYSYQDTNPYYLIKDIYFRNFTSKSGKCTTYKVISENMDLFKDVTVHTSWNASEEQ